MNIDHINISAPMPLLEEVRDFYCSVFHLSAGFRPEFSQKGYWLYFEDRPLIHLSESERRQAPGGPGFLDHIAFRLSGLKAVKSELESLGIEYRVSHVPEINMTQLFFTDPAGTGLEANFTNETL